jgi:hypothetical protein
VVSLENPMEVCVDVDVKGKRCRLVLPLLDCYILKRDCVETILVIAV